MDVISTWNLIIFGPIRLHFNRVNLEIKMYKSRDSIRRLKNIVGVLSSETETEPKTCNRDNFLLMEYTVLMVQVQGN